MKKSEINGLITALKEEQNGLNKKAQELMMQADKLTPAISILEGLTGKEPVAIRPKFELPWPKRTKKRAKRGPYKKDKYKNTDLNLVKIEKKVPVPGSIKSAPVTNLRKKYKKKGSIQWGREIKELIKVNGDCTKEDLFRYLNNKFIKNKVTRGTKQITKALGMLLYFKTIKRINNVDPRLVSYSIK